MPKNDNLRNKQNWTVSATLKLQAQHCADKTLVRIEDQTLSYVEALHSTQRCAGWLKSLDIKKRDYVAVMLPNCIEHCLSWFSLSWLGAVHVAVNTDYRGEFLRHVLHNCACEVLIVHTDYVEEVYKIAHKLKNLKQLIIVGDAGIGLEQDANKARFTITEFSDWARTTELLEATETDYRDLACVMYTSGTTGPSKGVMMTYAHIYLFGLGTIENMALTDEDIFYIVLPLFHANAMFMQLYASMIIGASVVIRRRFSGSQWLSDVIKYRATITNSLGVVSAFILNQPESDLDRKHSLRTMGMAPNSPAQELGLRERFGIQNVVGMYGMTEVNIPLYTPLGVSRPDTCGKVWEEFYEVEIVNPETDEICKRGETGEIVVRSRQPFGFMLGYLNMPEKTVEAWRNFWFHTGDAAWMDAEGYVFFVDRIKDCIRRRGENISSYQIETCIAEHPAIDEVAAYAVPSEISGDDEEIMIAFVQAPTAAISFEEIAEFSAETMPTFSIPRYFRQLDALPKTPTGKVQKHLLKTQAITKDSWDRQSPKSAIKP